MKQIDANIPLPTQNPESPQSSETKGLPWDLLTPGDSFLVLYEDGISHRKQSERINGLRSWQRVKDPSKRFMMRSLPDGIRVWRVS
jgi:hypothetical protein